MGPVSQSFLRENPKRRRSSESCELYMFFKNFPFKI